MERKAQEAGQGGLALARRGGRLSAITGRLITPACRGGMAWAERGEASHGHGEAWRHERTMPMADTQLKNRWSVELVGRGGRVELSTAAGATCIACAVRPPQGALSQWGPISCCSLLEPPHATSAPSVAWARSDPGEMESCVQHFRVCLCIPPVATQLSRAAARVYLPDWTWQGKAGQAWLRRCSSLDGSKPSAF